jgi:hypothetical protein
MRQRLRSSLTYANVMVTILAFVVLGGGTAFAAFVVSSNSQIGPGTVSGHHEPAGKHPNIISHSINGTDVEDLVFHQLTILGPGWSGGCFNTGAPSVAKSVQKVVHLRGGMCRGSGTSNLLFTLPTLYQPAKPEYLTVDQFNGATGRIVVNPNGRVFVVSDPEHPTAAAQFTSLAGVSYTLPR